MSCIGDQDKYFIDVALKPALYQIENEFEEFDDAPLPKRKLDEKQPLSDPDFVWQNLHQSVEAEQPLVEQVSKRLKLTVGETQQSLHLNVAGNIADQLLNCSDSDQASLIQDFILSLPDWKFNKILDQLSSPEQQSVQQSRLKFTSLLYAEKKFVASNLTSNSKVDTECATKQKTLTLKDDQKQLFESLDVQTTVVVPIGRTAIPATKHLWEPWSPLHDFECPIKLIPMHPDNLSSFDTYQWEFDIDFEENNNCPSVACENIFRPRMLGDWTDADILWNDDRDIIVSKKNYLVDPEIIKLHLDFEAKLNTSGRQNFNNKNSDLIPLAYETTKPTTLVPIRKRPNASLICHSTVAQKLLLVPWQMTAEEARNFHRPKATFINFDFWFNVHVLSSLQLECPIPGGIHSQADLSAQDNMIMLLEYTEQHPTLLSNVGMASKLRLYVGKENDEDDNDLDDVESEIGESVILTPTDISPFLGRIKPGQQMFGIENFLFKAPIFKHEVKHTDFLLICTPQNHWRIRTIPYVFTVGQTLPLQGMPSPSSKPAMAFAKNQLKRFIMHKLRSQGQIQLNDVKKAFPNETDPAIRAVLGECCTFERKGNVAQNWKPKEDILSNESLLKALNVSPEEICLNEASQAALTRLNDWGICRFNNPYSLSEATEAVVDNEHAQHALNAIKQEVQLMPWNVASTISDVMQGRIRLSIQSAGTDNSDQFAFAKTRTDSRVIKEAKDEKAGRLQDGSDLRKVDLGKAQEFLLRMGVSQADLTRMKRWTIIDMMRNIATEKAEQGSQDPEVLKYARPIQLNTNVRQKEFDDRAQRVFDRMTEFCQSTGEPEEDSLDYFEKELEALFESPEDLAAKEAKEAAETVRKSKATSKRAKNKKKSNKNHRDSSLNESVAESDQLPDEEQEMRALEEILLQQKLQIGSPMKAVGTLSISPEQELKQRIIYPKIIRKTSTFINDDGSCIKKIEYIRDIDKIIYYIRKKRNLEQKRSKIGNLANDFAMKVDDFDNRLYNHCSEELEALRIKHNSQIPKAHLGIAPTSKKKEWIPTSLFISLADLESCPENATLHGTPSIRCGQHAPKYRTYTWRRDGWTLLSADMVLLLENIECQPIGWRCNHKDKSTGIICGKTYVNTLRLIKKSLVTEIMRTGVDINNKLRTGYFIPK